LIRGSAALGAGWGFGENKKSVQMLGIKPQVSDVPSLRYGGCDMRRKYHMVHIDNQLRAGKTGEKANVHLCAM